MQGKRYHLKTSKSLSKILKEFYEKSGKALEDSELEKISDFLSIPLSTVKKTAITLGCVPVNRDVKPENTEGTVWKK